MDALPGGSVELPGEDVEEVLVVQTRWWEKDDDDDDEAGFIEVAVAVAMFRVFSLLSSSSSFLTDEKH